MTSITTSDYRGVAVELSAKANEDGTKTPVYGLDADALGAIGAVADNVLSVVTAIDDSTAGRATQQDQETTNSLLEDILTALQALIPASEHASITPSDSDILTGVRSVVIGVGGTIVLTVGGVDVSYTVVDGQQIAANVTMVKATGTTATGIVVLK